MGNCTAKGKKEESQEVDNSDMIGGSTVKIQLRRQTGLFGANRCPIDSEEIENVEKQLGEFEIEEAVSGGQFLADWKTVKFKKPCSLNEWWYLGEWDGKKMHGKGSLYNQMNEFLVTGVFKDNELVLSKCRKILKSGAYYIGSLNESLDPEGQGELVMSCTERYVGEFQGGLPHGSGREVKNDYEFTGKFAMGLKQYGSMKSSKGTYEGQFSDNMKQGNGTFISKNGDKYVGEWQKNKRHGEGTLYKKNGAIVFQGKWNHDKHVK